MYICLQTFKNNLSRVNYHNYVYELKKLRKLNMLKILKCKNSL